MRLNKLFKVSVAASLVIILLSLTILPACSSPSPATAPAQAQPAAVKQPSVIKINYAYYSTLVTVPQFGLGMDVQEWFCKELNTRSKGKVEAKFFPTETLCKGPDSLDALKVGIAHIARFSAESIPGRFPITESLIGSPLLQGNMRLIIDFLNKY